MDFIALDGLVSEQNNNNEHVHADHYSYVCYAREAPGILSFDWRYPVSEHKEIVANHHVYHLIKQFLSILNPVFVRLEVCNVHNIESI